MSISARKPRFFLDSLQAMGRLAAFALGVLTIIAILLGRLDPSPLDPRFPRAAAPVFVPGYLSLTSERNSKFLDPDTSQFLNVFNIKDRVLYEASCAPWLTAAGKSELIGVQVEHETGMLGNGSPQPRLVRIGLPGGSILGSVPLPGTVPSIAGAFCWLPELTARVLFAGLDGFLYACDFEDEASLPHVRRLAWAVPRPGGDGTRLRDPSRSSDPRLAGLVFVSLSAPRGSDSVHHASTEEVWWLRLNGEVVVETGRLANFASAEASVTRAFIRHPVLASRPDGSLFLACLSHEISETDWRLQVSPVVIDDKTGYPVARTERAQTLAEECLPVLPSLSSDGQWISVVAGGGEGQGQIRRLTIPGLADTAKASAAVPAPTEPQLGPKRAAAEAPPSHPATAWNAM